MIIISLVILGVFCLHNITPSVAAQIDHSCRHGWLLWRDSCFLFSTDKTTWTRAEELCRLYGGHLIEIHDSDKNDFVKDHLKILHYNDHKQVYWMGLTDVSGTWEWLTSGSTIEFNDWYSNQPQRNDEHCGALDGETLFQWHDYSCSQQEHFICEATSVES